MGKKLRTVLTVLGFGVCVNLYIVVTSVMRFVTDDLDRSVQRFTGVLFVQSRGLSGMSGIEWPPISSTIDEADAQSVLASPAVDRERSTAVSLAALAPPPFPTAPPEALLVGIEEGHEDVFLAGAGAMIGRPDFNGAAADATAPPAVLGVLAARHFASVATATMESPSPVGPIPLAAPGSRINVRGHEFVVQGIIEPDTNGLLRSAVLVPIGSARELLRQRDTVTALLISPARATDIEPLQREIEQAHPSLMVISDRQLADNARTLLDRVNQLFSVVRWTSVCVAALLIAIVMFVSVLERTRELGHPPRDRRARPPVGRDDPLRVGRHRRRRLDDRHPALTHRDPPGARTRRRRHPQPPDRAQRSRHPHRLRAGCLAAARRPRGPRRSDHRPPL